jgi:hypothetical protein
MGFGTPRFRPTATLPDFCFSFTAGLDLSGFQGTLRIVSRNTLLAVTALQLGNSPGQFSALTVKPLFR